jgi:hypothetical protein
LPSQDAQRLANCHPDRVKILVLNCPTHLILTSSTKRFQHPDGDLNDKSFGDLFNFFKDYFRRVDDDWENTGFPVVQISNNKLKNFKENVMWVGHSSVMINHSNLTILTDPQFSDYASPFSFMGPRRATPATF